MAGKELTERQLNFVVEYLEDFNASAAYQRAGYEATGNSAEVSASKLLRQPKIREALACAREELMARVVVDKDYIMGGLREVYERCMQAKPVVDKKGNPTGEWQFNAQGANKALELMGKELGMFGDKVEVGGGLEPIKTLTIVKHVRDDGPQVNAH